jgi:type II secretory pathway component HofQ
LAEHEAIRDRLMLARASDDPRARDGILPIRVGDGEVPGISFNTIVPDVRERAPRETAQLIADRLGMLLPDLAFPAEEVTYSGDRITLNHNDIEVRAILQLLFDFAGLNLVMSDTVRGNMPLRLKNVPWDQVVDIVLEAKGLGMRQTGNVIKIAPLVELAALEKLELEMQLQVDSLQPLHTEFIKVKHAGAAELAKLLSSAPLGVLSERGALEADERTNTLIARDIQPCLDALRGIVERLDVPVQ